jgi:hypothetical protein
MMFSLDSSKIRRTSVAFILSSLTTLEINIAEAYQYDRLILSKFYKTSIGGIDDFYRCYILN